jgi:2-polyprenyl-6-methoxyphenol hydroxylase-like FAD-dependent oxidoreductase
MGKLGGSAVVVGAGFGGLLAARVLADFYETVTIVERDVLPPDPVNRRGVPQGRHAHLLNARGSQILEELFPGFLHELLGSGVGRWSDGDLSKLHISFGGHVMTRATGASTTTSPDFYFPSRPLLEWAVLKRLRAIARVTLVEGHEVTALTSTPDRDRVTGVRLVDCASCATSTIDADLVVDATGRGSRMPMFLDQLGYGRPREDEVVVGMGYASQLLRLPRGAVPEDLIVVFPEPGRPRTWVLIGYENDTWMFSLGTLGGAPLPRDRAEMLAFGADFAPAHASRAVRAAEPLSDITHHHLRSNRWRRYDKMRRTPEGLIVFGDAVSSFNPIYGQGMTVAGIEAVTLRDCLRRGEHDLAGRFYHAIANCIRVAWHTAVGSDLALPEIRGRAPVSMRITNAYLDRVLAAAESDPLVSYQFLRVVGMLDPPRRLLRPAMMLRVAAPTRSRPPHPHAPQQWGGRRKGLGGST